jgi:hypothetical protein
MSQMNIANVDLNLLKVFEALHEESSASLEVGRPSMASAIAPVSMQCAELRHANHVSGATTNIA